MEIIKPQVELWKQDDTLLPAYEHVARCARVCYASNKTTKNAEMYKRLLTSNHNSMFRHESMYIIAPGRNDRYDLINRFEDCPYVDYRIDYDNNEIYISTNRQFFMENKSIRYFGQWLVTPSQFVNTMLGKEIMRYTFKVVTQISTSRELNRVSPNNISEQSTIYVNFSKKGGAICQPYWMTDAEVEAWEDNDLDGENRVSLYLNSCDQAFEDYNYLLKDDMLPQDARGVLPLDTATVCVYTYTISEWRHIIDLRYYGTTGAAHPNAVIIAGMIRDELIKLGYEFPKTEKEN